MSDAAKVHESIKQVRGVASSTPSGEALDSSGDIDADTLCAVAAVSAATLTEVGELLSAGRLERWYFTTAGTTYYVSERAEERLVALGEPVRSAESTSKALHALG